MGYPGDVPLSASGETLGSHYLVGLAHMDLVVPALDEDHALELARKYRDEKIDIYGYPADAEPTLLEIPEEMSRFYGKLAQGGLARSISWVRIRQNNPIPNPEPIQEIGLETLKRKEVEAVVLCMAALSNGKWIPTEVTAA